LPKIASVYCAELHILYFEEEEDQRNKFLKIYYAFKKKLKRVITNSIFIKRIAVETKKIGCFIEKMNAENYIVLKSPTFR
jgi:hypothetical protein